MELTYLNVIDVHFETAAIAGDGVRVVLECPDRDFFGELFPADEKRMGPMCRHVSPPDYVYELL
jgi:hypothetical protein